MLFEPERHETLTSTPWSESTAQAYLNKIIDETCDYFKQNSNWLVTCPEFFKAPKEHANQFFGSAGVLLALHKLAPQKITSQMITYLDQLHDLNKKNLAELNKSMPCPQDAYGLLIGETGLNWAAYRIRNQKSDLETLLGVAEQNETEPTLDLMWSAPGTMLIALQIYRETQSAKALEIFKKQAKFLWQHWKSQDESDIFLWLQDLYGAKSTLLGMVHGVVGNLLPFILGRDLLETQMSNELFKRIESTLLKTAISEGDLINWPQSYGTPRPGRNAMLIQVCHGAPGIIMSLAECYEKISKQFDNMLLKAGETTWQAGPLAKPSGLCHGTAGNGYAFLALHKQTGEKLWLDRARQYAMHAIEQSQKQWQEQGMPYYSLWLGDLGLACYLSDCITSPEGECPTFWI